MRYQRIASRANTDSVAARGPRRWGAAVCILFLSAPVFLAGCSALPVKSPAFRARGSTGLPQPQVSVRPPLGALYANTTAPLSTTFNQTPAGGKKGSATTYSVGIPFLWGGAARIAWGDGSLETAEKNGGIKKLNYADYNTFSILSVYTELTVHAYGE